MIQRGEIGQRSTIFGQCWLSAGVVLRWYVRTIV